MQDLQAAWDALRFGGAMMYPLLFLGVLATAIILDRAIVYARRMRLPGTLRALIETPDFAWDDLERQLPAVGPRNAFGRFVQVIATNRGQPVWWVESRAGEEAGHIEQVLSRGLWVLETIVTAAPLLGLLGTVTGMMGAFRIIGGSGLVAPERVTAGVAQALIATALGLMIAVLALFAFNFFARVQARALDEMERIGTQLVNRIRLDHERDVTPLHLNSQRSEDHHEVA